MAKFQYCGRLITKHVSNNKTRFSEEVIDDILEHQPAVPVSVNFSDINIGSTTGFYGDEKGIIVRIDVAVADLEQLGLYLVPQGLVKTSDLSRGEDGVTVINKMQLTSVGIVSVPADSHLTKLEKD